MQVLITGAAGRLGQILRSSWTHATELGFDPIWSVRRAQTANDNVWDILAGSAPFIAKSSVILHLAGVLSGDKSALSDNAVMVANLCAAAEKAGAKHVFVASSAAVYGAGESAHTEDEDPAPLTDYGHAKLHMEQTALNWANRAKQGAPGLTCLRIGNVLGADALLGGPVTRQIELDAIVGQPGGPIRSYIGPMALSQVLARLVRLAAAGVALPRILNIAAPEAVRMADLLQAAQRPYRYRRAASQVAPIVRIATQRLAGLIPLPQSDARAMVDDWRQLTADRQ